jgi:hypothetical protein
MLKNIGERVKTCLRLAEDCARQAAAQSDPKLRQDFLDNEARWLKLARSYELSERLTAFSQWASRVFYSVHVRRKDGVWQRELQNRQGKLPNPGDEIRAILHGEIVAARVMVLTTNPNSAKGDPATDVHAEEI